MHAPVVLASVLAALATALQQLDKHAPGAGIRAALAVAVTPALNLALQRLTDLHLLRNGGLGAWVMQSGAAL
eukprot:1161798-Pelagomonas_calceolata.AAC.10